MSRNKDITIRDILGFGVKLVAAVIAVKVVIFVIAIIVAAFVLAGLDLMAY